MVLTRLDQVGHVARAPLHVETIEAQVFAGCSGFVVRAHPRDEICHLVGAVDGEADCSYRLVITDRCDRSLGGIRLAVDIAVHNFASTEVAFQRESAHVVFLYEHFEDIKLELLELGITVRCLTERNDLHAVGNCNVIHALRVGGKFVGVSARSSAETAEVGERTRNNREHDHDAEYDPAGAVRFPTRCVLLMHHRFS